MVPKPSTPYSYKIHQSILQAMIIYWDAYYEHSVSEHPLKHSLYPLENLAL